MITENLSTLKIHKLTQEQYDRELASGNIDENALYLTPDVVTDVDELIDMMNEYKEKTTNEINSINENIEAKDLFETKHEEGNAIAVNDSAGAPFVGMKLYGKTTQDGTPTPDAPVPLVSVGDSGSFEVEVYGKNLWNNANAILNSTAFTKTDTGFIFNRELQTGGTYVSFKTPLHKGQTITFSAQGSNYAPNVYIYKEKIYGTIIARDQGSLVYTAIEDLPNATFAIIINSDEGSNEVSNIQIEIGTQATSYEPFKAKQSMTFTDTLRGIGDIKDEIDFNRGVTTKRFEKRTFNGSEAWVLNTSGTNTQRFHLALSEAKSSGNGVCTHFNWITSGFSNDIELIGVYEGNLFLRVSKTIASTVAELQTWLASNNITVVYELETPIETPLTETELNAYRHLMTNKPNTTILSEADMEVDYVVDSTSAEYIENRLEEVQDKIPTKTSQLTNDSSFVNQTGLDNALEDKLSFDEEVVNSTSDVAKIVPEGSGKYAAVNKVGGMSYKSSNLLDLPEEVTLTTAGYVAQEVPVLLSAGKSYSLSYMQVGGTNCTLTLNTASGGFSFKSIAAAMVGRTSTIIEPTEDIVSISFKLGGAGTFSQCMLNEGTTVLPYEPYYSGLRNAYVSEINSVGKNLYSGGDLSFTKAEVVTLNNRLEAGTYTISGVVTSTDTRYNTVTISFIAGNENGANVNISFEKDKRAATTFTLINPVESIRFNASITFNESAGYDATCTDIQIELGTEATPYEPYKENTFTIPTGARGEGYGLGINEDCYNYVDFERKVYIQNCAKVDLGSLEWTLMTGNRFMSNEIENLKMAQSQATPINAICDSYTTVNFETLYGQSVDKTIGAPYDNHSIYVVDKAYTDTTALKAALNGVYCIYELETPIETDISDYIQDNFIEVAAGGVITAVNEYGYDVPTEISFFTSENPEKVIVADKIVGDFVGTFIGDVTGSAKTLEGLTSTVDELNRLDVGGRNLALRTGGGENWTLERYGDYWQLSAGTFEINQVDEMGGTAAVKWLPTVSNDWISLSINKNRPFKQTGTHICSLWLKADEDTTVRLFARATSESTTIYKTVKVTTEWQRFYFIVDVVGISTQQHFFIRADGTIPLYTSHWQVERGNRLTEWRPAIEDNYGGAAEATTLTGLTVTAEDLNKVTGDTEVSLSSDVVVQSRAVGVELAEKANNSIATTTFAGLMSPQDKLMLYELYKLVKGEVPTEGLAYTLKDDGTYACTGIGTATATELVIPGTYNGVAVTSIGAEAFRGNTTITSVRILEGISEIGEKAFYNTEINLIMLPESLKTIGLFAFYGLDAHYVDLPEDLTTIGESAFYSAYIYNVTLPKYLRTIGADAFRSTTLTSIVFPTYYNITVGASAFESSDIEFLKIPKNVNLGVKAFQFCYDLKAVIFEEGCKSIPEKCFGSNSKLEYVKIPKSLESIGTQAFGGCESLGSIVLSEDSPYFTMFSNCLYSKDLTSLVRAQIGPTEFSFPSEITTIEDSAFEESHLQTIDIPEGVTTMGERVFEGSQSLESVNLPSTLTVLGDYAFYTCKSLKSIDIPEGVTSIGYACFAYCSALESVKLPSNLTSLGVSVFNYCDSLKTITMDQSSGTYRVEDNALYNYSEGKLIVYPKKSTLTTFTTPDYLKTISNDAFKNCTYLKKVILNEGLTSVGTSAFEGCISLQTVNIPSTINSFSSSTSLFKNCKALTSITIPNTVTSVAQNMFEGCTKLSAVNLSTSCSNVQNYMFKGCTSLARIVIPEGVTAIGRYAFQGCTALGQIVLPKSLRYVYENAFDGCTNLRTVYYRGTSSEWSSVNRYSGNSYLNNATKAYNYTGN